jgi:hypothetical protein
VWMACDRARLARDLDAFYAWHGLFSTAALGADVICLLSRARRDSITSHDAPPQPGDPPPDPPAGRRPAPTPSIECHRQVFGANDEAFVTHLSTPARAIRSGADDDFHSLTRRASLLADSVAGKPFESSNHGLHGF